MGGLISNAAGALCKGAGYGAGARRAAGAHSGKRRARQTHGQWQISQAEQVACSCRWHSADASAQWLPRSAAVLVAGVVVGRVLSSFVLVRCGGLRQRQGQQTRSHGGAREAPKDSTTMRTKNRPRRMPE